MSRLIFLSLKLGMLRSRKLYLMEKIEIYIPYKQYKILSIVKRIFSKFH